MEQLAPDTLDAPPLAGPGQGSLLTFETPLPPRTQS